MLCASVRHLLPQVLQPHALVGSMLVHNGQHIPGNHRNELGVHLVQGPGPLQLRPGQHLQTVQRVGELSEGKQAEYARRSQATCPDQLQTGNSVRKSWCIHARTLEEPAHAHQTLHR